MACLNPLDIHGNLKNNPLTFRNIFDRFFPWRVTAGCQPTPHLYQPDTQTCLCALPNLNDFLIEAVRQSFSLFKLFKYDLII